MRLKLLCILLFSIFTLNAQKVLSSGNSGTSGSPTGGGWTYNAGAGTIVAANGSSIFASPIIGGTTTTSSLILQPTAGSGTTGSDIIFKVGNNGAVTAMDISDTGNIIMSGINAANGAVLALNGFSTGGDIPRLLDMGGQLVATAGSQNLFGGTVTPIFVSTTQPNISATGWLVDGANFGQIGATLPVAAYGTYISGPTIGSDTNIALVLTGATGVAAPGYSLLSMITTGSPSFGFDITLESSATGDLSLRRQNSGVFAEMMHFARASGVVTFAAAPVFSAAINLPAGSTSSAAGAANTVVCYKAAGVLGWASNTAGVIGTTCN